jgi:hypothetical protein
MRDFTYLRTNGNTHSIQLSEATIRFFSMTGDFKNEEEAIKAIYDIVQNEAKEADHIYLTATSIEWRLLIQSYINIQNGKSLSFVDDF